MSGSRRYSLARYSVNPEDKTLEAEARFSASMGALVGAAVPVSSRARFDGALRGSVRGAVSVASAFSAYTSLEAAVQASADVPARGVFAGTLLASAYGQKDVPAALASLGELDAQIWASKDLPASMEAAGHLNAHTAGSKDVTATMRGFEVLTTSLEATSQATERAVFEVVIPPGGELRVDSDLFTVLLDGQNALHLQLGDWIFISRELMRIDIESASGRLEGQMIYTERYL